MGDRVEHPPLKKNLVLIGGRGCGKSSLAKRLARANRHFMLFSLDALVRYEADGAKIPEIVAREGWPGFRARELAVVEKVAAIEGGALIDAGGGVVVELDRDGARALQRAQGRCAANDTGAWCTCTARSTISRPRRRRREPARPLARRDVPRRS